MLRVGIIGYGKMGMLHGALLCGSGEAEISAICDKSFVMRFGFSKVYKGVHTYIDYKRMLKDEDLDIVVIATPPFNHIECAMNAMEHGCNVFMEKPMTTNYQSAKAFKNFTKERVEVVQIGFCNRFVPTIAYGRDLVLSGAIGDVKSVEAHMYIADVFQKNEGWRYKKDISGGGVLIDFGIHMVDLLTWYFGEIERVKARTVQLYSEMVEDEVYAEIDFKNGVHCSFDTSWSKANYRKSYANLNIHGTAGRIEITEQTIVLYDENGNIKRKLSEPELYTGAFLDIGGINYAKQIEAFLDNLKQKKCVTGCSVNEAYYDQAVVKAMYMSAEADAPAKLPGVTRGGEH